MEAAAELLNINVLGRVDIHTQIAFDFPVTDNLKDECTGDRNVMVYDFDPDL